MELHIGMRYVFQSMSGGSCSVKTAVDRTIVPLNVELKKASAPAAQIVDDAAIVSYPDWVTI
ncbi:MAG: hypothetical protein HY914_10555 [Desulfomonile tiedjei]|nr:hypothetical protein [Desulfomonile tiedjei]